MRAFSGDRNAVLRGLFCGVLFLALGFWFGFGLFVSFILHICIKELLNVWVILKLSGSLPPC